MQKDANTRVRGILQKSFEIWPSDIDFESIFNDFYPKVS